MDKNFSALLVEAVNKPGSLMQAYSLFHNYSLGNQLLALFQCHRRGLEVGPINTFPGWQALGRYVKKGERALELCMPVTVKRKARADSDAGELDSDESFATVFVHKSRWFVLSQTEGADVEFPSTPMWDADKALAALNIEQVPFTCLDGNTQGIAKKHTIAINPVAQLPHKTRFHEIAHVVLGHTEHADFNDSEHLPHNLREAEAESVALLCGEALGLDGAEFARGYIQHWLAGDSIPDKSAQKILTVAGQILKAGAVAAN